MIKFFINSHTNNKTKYLVFLTEKGWHCTCPNFVFNEKKIQTDKHIIEAYEKLGAVMDSIDIDVALKMMFNWQGGKRA